MMKRSKAFAALVLCMSLVLMLVMGLMETTTDHTPAFWVGELGFLFFSFLSFGFMIANGDLPLRTVDEKPKATGVPTQEISVGLIFLPEDITKDLADFLAKSMPKSGIREDDGE